MPSAGENIRARLFELRDERYKLFHQALMPTVPHERVIGVRVPKVRALAKEIAGTAEAEEFMREQPHYYYEENNLHGVLTEHIRDFDAALGAVDAFLPYVDNWATCDLFSPKVFGGHRDELLPAVTRWISSEQTYTVRYGIGMLMRWYLDEEFRPEYPELVAGVRSEEYYVNMMRAWYFATALAKQPEAVWPWLEQKRLDRWTHNKTVQKCMESGRISPQTKQRLRALRI